MIVTSSGEEGSFHKWAKRHPVAEVWEDNASLSFFPACCVSQISHIGGRKERSADAAVNQIALSVVCTVSAGGDVMSRRHPADAQG
jgi:hypothetical protein